MVLPLPRKPVSNITGKRSSAIARSAVLSGYRQKCPRREGCHANLGRLSGMIPACNGRSRQYDGHAENITAIDLILCLSGRSSKRQSGREQPKHYCKPPSLATIRERKIVIF